jgi:hypothetical protein
MMWLDVAGAHRAAHGLKEKKDWFGYTPLGAACSYASTKRGLRV